MKTLTYFVPVDFSDCSYNALQYAITLARFSEGQVRLCHVIDLEEVPESDNQVVVNWSLDRLNRKAANKMKSLKELVAMEGVSVDEVLVMGNVKLELLRQIENVNPHVIVMGRKNEGQPGRSSMVTYIKRNTQVPVLIVPGSDSQKLPRKPMLVSETKPELVSSLEPLFGALSRTSQQLAILDGSNPNASQELIKKLQADYGIEADLVLWEKNGKPMRTIEYIRSSTGELLNTIKRSRNFFERMFSKEEVNEQGTLRNKVG